MPIINIFLLVGIVALIFSFFKGKNAIWGGATFGLVIGLIMGIFSGDFSNIIRAVLIGADVGLVAELLPAIPEMFSKIGEGKK